MKRIALPSLLTILLVSACAADGASPDSGGGGGGGDAGGGIPHPEGDDLVLSVSSEGGFLPVEMVATQLPHFVLLGDGRVITQGAQTLEFPGPLLPPLQVRTLTEEGIQEVLAALAETGLFTSDLDLTGASNFIADAPNTVFTVHADGADVTVSVYGLGFLGPDMAEGEEGQEGISAAEAEAHRVLTEVNERLMQIDQWLPADSFADSGWQPYEPDAFRLYVRDATGEPQDDLEGQLRAWPAADDPATLGGEVPAFGNGTRCAVVEGEDAQAWLAELQAANQLTRWSDDGARRFAVMPRPILPHEERACPELAGA